MDRAIQSQEEGFYKELEKLLNMLIWTRLAFLMGLVYIGVMILCHYVLNICVKESTEIS
jgi:hypothetical protein